MQTLNIAPSCIVFGVLDLLEQAIVTRFRSVLIPTLLFMDHHPSATWSVRMSHGDFHEATHAINLHELKQQLK